MTAHAEIQNKTLDIPELPHYVSFNILNKKKAPKILKSVAHKITFPLSKKDSEDIKTLEAKFDHEEGCAGLAAPQIGISKSIIVFAAPDDPELKKWRKDFTQSIEKQIWINPSYEGVPEDGMRQDYEACFSVAGVAASVNRYKKIKYRAYNTDGNLIEGIAEGFLARIIQHETDHINGILFVDIAEKDTIKSLEEYRAAKKAAMDKEK